MIIDFDKIDNWAPKLTAILSSHVPDSAKKKLLQTPLEFVDDAQDLLFKQVDREIIIDNVLIWLQSMKISGYHGSRLTEKEIDSVRSEGLLPLEANSRHHRLTRALSPHPRWSQVSGQLDTVIQKYGQGKSVGHREGQVHLTLSRAGLTKSFNQYLIYGSEFDRHVASELLGKEGRDLLSQDGKARVIQFAVPGNFALNATHSIVSIDSMRADRKVPNLINEFITSWSYQLAVPSFQTQSLKTDCGMTFRKTVPAAWIVSIETLHDI